MKLKITYKIKVIGEGLFDFSEIPGVDGKLAIVRCGSFERAVELARRIEPNFNYEVEINWGAVSIDALNRHLIEREKGGL